MRLNAPRIPAPSYLPHAMKSGAADGEAHRRTRPEECLNSCSGLGSELRLDEMPAGFAAASIVARIQAGVPARRVASRSTSSTLTSLRSNKMGRDFQAESGGEGDALILADVLEDVADFLPQAVCIVHRVGGRLVRAYPDLAVRRLDGRVELWEIKSGLVKARPSQPKHSSQDAALVERLARLALALRAHGVGYRVLTETWLCRQPQLANACLLFRQGDRPVTADISAAVEAALILGCHTLGDLSAATRLDHPVLLGAAARGAFAVDIAGGPLGGRSKVRPARAGARSGGFEENQG